MQLNLSVWHFHCQCFRLLHHRFYFFAIDEQLANTQHSPAAYNRFLRRIHHLFNFYERKRCDDEGRNAYHCPTLHARKPRSRLCCPHYWTTISTSFLIFIVANKSFANCLPTYNLLLFKKTAYFQKKKSVYFAMQNKRFNFLTDARRIIFCPLPCAKDTLLGKQSDNKGGE